MPPVSPQGSRGGLITAVVVFTILFVVSTVSAIFYAVQYGKAEDTNKQLTERSKIIYSETTSPAFNELSDQAKKARGSTVLDQSIQNTKRLVQVIMGNPPTVQQAQNAEKVAKDKLDEVAKALKLDATPDSLLTAVDLLKSRYADQVEAVAKAQSAVASAQSDWQTKLADYQKNLAAYKDSNDKDLQDKKKAMDDAQAAHQRELDKLNDEIKKMDADRQTYNAALKAKEDQYADLSKKFNSVKDELGKTLTRYDQKIRRIKPEESVVRQGDGAILTVAANNIVYINLGQGDHITPGMTFEVYSRTEGVPPMGEGLSDTDMPAGEGSIEIQQVMASSAQARVTKIQQGQRIAEGDIVANLVYDRNTKYNFVVYGKFDTQQSGQPSIADRDVIKALVVQWGGKLQTEKEIGVDTDFIVMGAEPKVDDVDPQDAQDPFVIQRHDQQLAEQTAYENVIATAKDLHIPIMNQNRFLYFCGYYDLANR